MQRFIRPIKDTLESIIQEIIGSVDAKTLRLCVESIVGQQLFPSITPGQEKECHAIAHGQDCIVRFTERS